MNCPNCNKKQHSVCGNPECVCYQGIPEGEKTQVWVDGDLIACAYCGHTLPAYVWEDMEIESFIKETGANSLSEAMDVIRERKTNEE
jgi:hypothetical protein